MILYHHHNFLSTTTQTPYLQQLIPEKSQKINTKNQKDKAGFSVRLRIKYHPRQYSRFLHP